MKLDATTAKLVLGSPSTSSETLADIARDFPDLQAQVAAHPAATPDLLDWLRQYGTPEARAAVAAQPSTTPDPSFTPDPPPGIPAPTHKTRNIVLVAAIVAAVALVVWLLADPLAHHNQTPSGTSTLSVSRTPTPPAPSVPVNPQWTALPYYSSGTGTIGPTQVMDAGNNLMVVSTQYNAPNGCEFGFTALDATTWTSNWSWSMQCDTRGSIDMVAGNGVIAAVDADTLHLIDASDGEEISSMAFASNDYLVGLVDGILIISDGTILTARPAVHPDSVAWQAAAIPSHTNGPTPGIFGGGTWINTNQGVLEVATGQPASFGSDATVSPDGTQYVYYDGPSEADVVRHYCDPSSCGAQIWDPAFDRVRASLFTSNADEPTGLVCTDPEADHLATITPDSSGDTTLTSYSWQTGLQLTQASWSTITLIATCGWFAGYTYLMPDSDGGFDGALITTGGTISPESNAPSSAPPGGVATVQGIAYLVSGTMMTAYDGNNGFAQLWSIQLPAAGEQLQSVGGHLFAIGASASQAWVLTNGHGG